VTINNDTGRFSKESRNRNGRVLKSDARNDERASLVPAAAVIPALIAYIKVVAVKKLVVGFVIVFFKAVPGLRPRARARDQGSFPKGGGFGFRVRRKRRSSLKGQSTVFFASRLRPQRRTTGRDFTLKKLECSKQAVLRP